MYYYCHGTRYCYEISFILKLLNSFPLYKLLFAVYSDLVSGIYKRETPPYLSLSNKYFFLLLSNIFLLYIKYT